MGTEYFMKNLLLGSGCFCYCMGLFLDALGTAWVSTTIFWILSVLHGELNGNLLTSSGCFKYCKGI